MRGARRCRDLPRVAVVMISVAAGASPVEAQWTLGPPDLVLGEATGVSFVNVVGVAARDDHIYVADAGLAEIHAFDMGTGEHLASTGRFGEGPGEFRGLAWIGDCGGDSIFASDNVLYRVSVYSWSLDHLRTFRLEPSAERLVTGIQCAGSGLLAISQLADSELTSSAPMPTIGETYRSMFEVALFDQEGAIRHAIGPFAGGERYRSPGALPDRYNDLPLLWGRHPVLGAAEWGFVLGTNEDWSLLRYNLDGGGEAVDTLRLAENRVAVSESDRAAYIQRRVQRSEDAGRPTEPTRRYWEEYPYPTLFPAYTKIVALPDGFVWVEGFAAPYLGQTAKWKVFAPDGTLTATLDVPERFQLLWVGETHAAGIATDALDVQTVEVRPIQRPEG